MRLAIYNIMYDILSTILIAYDWFNYEASL